MIISTSNLILVFHHTLHICVPEKSVKSKLLAYTGSEYDSLHLRSLYNLRSQPSAAVAQRLIACFCQLVYQLVLVHAFTFIRL